MYVNIFCLILIWFCIEFPLENCRIFRSIGMDHTRKEGREIPPDSVKDHDHDP